MKFLVMSEKDIKTYYTNLSHIIISISTPGSFKTYIPYNERCLDTLHLDFSDFDDPNRTYPEYIELFTRKQAQAILNFVNRYKEKIELIICQCEAGISRSAATAAALSKILNGEDEEFFKRYLPNRLVYRMILEAKSE